MSGWENFNAALVSRAGRGDKGNHFKPEAWAQAEEIRMKKKAPVTVTLTVVGMAHRVTFSLRTMIQSYIERAGPMLCRVKREPDNQADPNAIKVIAWEGPYKRFHIGYLRRSVAEVWAPLIDSEKLKVKEAHLTEVDPREGDGEIVLKVITTADVKRWIRKQQR